MDGYVEESKGQVNKSLAVQALQSCKLAPTNSSTNQWNAKSLVCHFLSNILPLYF